MPGYSKSEQIGKTVNPKKKSGSAVVSRTTEWDKARLKLKTVYASHRITRCEFVDKDGKKCGSTEWLTFAHADKRRNLEPGDLGSIQKTLLLCMDHHQLIEYDRDETERLFAALRPL